MSLLVSELISNNQQRTNTAGKRIGDADFHLFLNDAVKYFYTNLKLPTAEREMDLVTYPGVLEYGLPDDFIGVIEPKRPYGMHSPDFDHTVEGALYRWPYGRQTSIKYKRDTPILLLTEIDGYKSIINSCNSVDDNGTWAVSGDGSGLIADKQIYTEGTASLRFKVTASGGTTTLTISDQPAIDLTDFVELGRAFLNLGTPSTNTAALNSVTLRLGTDASNYYEMQSTERHSGESLLDGFGIISFDFLSKTTTGTPTDTNIVYVQVIIDHGISGVDGYYRLDDIFLAQGTYYQLPYYSKYIVKNASGVYQQKVTDNSDTVVCPTDLDEAIEYKMLEQIAAQRLKDTALANYYARELKPKETYLRSKYPRQESRNQTNWAKSLISRL